MKQISILLFARSCCALPLVMRHPDFAVMASNKKGNEDGNE